MKKALLSASLLVALVGLASLRPPVSQATSNNKGVAGSGNGLTAQAIVVPKITKAAFEKKDLIVEGENFVAGAKLLLNGTKPLKTQNDDTTPSTKLIVKKASKTLPEDEIISLQVKNPDGLVSEAFGFFTGLTLTFHNTINGSSTSFAVGRFFLLNFDDPGFEWQIFNIAHLDDSVEVISFKVPLLPKAQGLFWARQSGGTIIYMRGEQIGQPPFVWQVGLEAR